MANKNWGFKIYCECGAKYYSMNKENQINCPVCSAIYVQEDLNLRTVSPVLSAQKTQPIKKLDDVENIDDTSIDDNDDIISLDDQKELEEPNENFQAE